jgi:predicted phosphate transport protein (TIGR00153 family)
LGLFNRISKDTTFYDILEAQAETAHQAALVFLKLAGDFAHREEHVQEIDRLESEGDTLTHQLANKADSTFVTPLDKEDLHALSNSLDEITDMIDSCTARLDMYQINEPRPDLQNLVELLVEITEVTRGAVSFLRTLKSREKIHEVLVRIHALENQADRRFRQSLGELVNAPDADPIQVLKWKEIYDRIERAVDQCERVANLVESVVIKYA